MDYLFYFLSTSLILIDLLSLIPHTHWIFRVCDFAKIQLAVGQFFVVIISLIFFHYLTPYEFILNGALALLMIKNVVILFKYTQIYSYFRKNKNNNPDSQIIKVLSVNVYQFNPCHQKLIDLIKEVSPDIILTIESNREWETSFAQLKQEYTYFCENALENTYGMHFYSRLKTTNITTHYFVADDIPSIEAEIETEDGHTFTFWGVHPPPPSPTESQNSKERDGELVAVAKKVRELKAKAVVTGDFNNVAWTKSSQLFKKTSELVDARVGRGFISTFHAKYWFFRFPIDLFFHSSEIVVKKLTTLKEIGSDHFPLYSEFYFVKGDSGEETESTDAEEEKEGDEMVEEGKKETEERPNKTED